MQHLTVGRKPKDKPQSYTVLSPNFLKAQEAYQSCKLHFPMHSSEVVPQTVILAGMRVSGDVERRGFMVKSAFRGIFALLPLPTQHIHLRESYDDTS